MPLQSVYLSFKKKGKKVFCEIGKNKEKKRREKSSRNLPFLSERFKRKN